jgi:hypothetical protein
VALEQKNYTAAIAAITAWLQSQRAITQWRDPQVAASKLELKALEERLRILLIVATRAYSSLMSSTISISLASGR